MGASKSSDNPENTLSKELIRDLREHCVGGFVLYYFNKNGMPRQASVFDTNVHSLAMQKYMGDCATALQELYIDGAREDFMHQPDSNEDVED